MAIYFSIATKLVQGVEIYYSVSTTQEVQIVVSQPSNLF